MKQKDLVAAAEEFNTIMDFKGDNAIDTGLSVPDLKKQIKEAALWLWATDEVSSSTVAVLKQLNWKKSDFENLKDNQDPLPAFYRYGILEKQPVEEPTEPAAQKEDDTPPQEPEEDDTVIEVTEEDTEYLDKAPPVTDKEKKGPSAYGTALAIVGQDPFISYPDLCDRMREEGFDIQKKAGTIKTARSIARKMWRYYGVNGFIKDEFLKK